MRKITTHVFYFWNQNRVRPGNIISVCYFVLDFRKYIIYLDYNKSNCKNCRIENVSFLPMNMDDNKGNFAFNATNANAFDQ